ncbi:hypothetical protein L6452_09126 [Arctium lappa]|uniref:Uncharacterized protein n=1 Tax=Arctium lappa TaxID=4217 RepID=A0ACB9DJH3_ARCLA|nr:hypothetical protein L6452_09126 [Arctium lappa]
MPTISLRNDFLSSDGMSKLVLPRPCIRRVRPSFGGGLLLSSPANIADKASWAVSLTDLLSASPFNGSGCPLSHHPSTDLVGPYSEIADAQPPSSSAFLS